jgi:hypothetical protein
VVVDSAGSLPVIASFCLLSGVDPDLTLTLQTAGTQGAQLQGTPHGRRVTCTRPQVVRLTGVTSADRRQGWMLAGRGVNPSRHTFGDVRVRNGVPHDRDLLHQSGAGFPHPNEVTIFPLVWYAVIKRFSHILGGFASILVQQVAFANAYSGSFPGNTTSG